MPMLDSNFQYSEGFEHPQRKNVIKRSASMPILDMNKFAPLDNSNSKERESNKRGEKTASNAKKQRTTKVRPRVSNIQTRDANNKSTKIASNFRSGKPRDSEKKQTSDKEDQKRKVYILGNSMVKGIKHWKMQSKDTSVVVRSFPGAKVRQMKYYAKPAEEDNNQF